MKQTSFRGILSLTLAAFLWGFAFVAQSNAADRISAEAFTLFRFVLGAVILLPVIFIRDRMQTHAARSASSRDESRDTRSARCGFFSRFADPLLLRCGALCGTLIFAASFLQQYSFTLGTTSGKCGFLTAMYMVFVPLAGLLFGKKVPIAVWCGVGISVGGMYLLCLSGGTTMAAGDIAVLISALFYTAHILTVDRIVHRVDCVRLSCLQFLVAGILGGVVTCFTGFPPVSVLHEAAISILYVGIFSSGVAYTLQIVGQKHCSAAIAPLLMSLESVFAALGGFLLQNERMTSLQFLGCAMIFFAVILVQLPPIPSLRKQRRE